MIWYDAKLMEGVSFHNKPGAKKHPKVYGSTFFPFLEPVKVCKGDDISTQIKATLLDDDYVWNWHTQITGEPGEEKAQFEQSTFYSQWSSLADLRKNDLGYVPAINLEGEIDKFIVSSMNGSATIEKIAKKIVREFPSKFRDVRDAAARVSNLAKKYSD